MRSTFSVLTLIFNNKTPRAKFLGKKKKITVLQYPSVSPIGPGLALVSGPVITSDHDAENATVTAGQLKLSVGREESKARPAFTVSMVLLHPSLCASVPGFSALPGCTVSPLCGCVYIVRSP